MSMCVHETSFCFVCAHLTAGEEPGDAARRAFDFQEIVRRTSFARGDVLDPNVAAWKYPETMLEHE